MSTYAKSIVLPCDEVFRNLKNAKRFAIDIGEMCTNNIKDRREASKERGAEKRARSFATVDAPLRPGGSLAKLAYSSTVSRKESYVTPCELAADGSQSLYNVSEKDTAGVRLHFVKFETKYIESCLDFIKDNMNEETAAQSITATGGGAHKYFQLITNKLGLRVDKEDELDCLISGCNFLLKNIADESFTYHHHDDVKYRFKTIDHTSICPYLLVNIGSGVSVVKVDSSGVIERVGGSSFGGGSFWGLGSLLTKAQDFDHLLRMAEEGDHREVDMLVSEIYGGDYAKLGLPADLIASSFAKLVRGDNPDKEYCKPKGEDLARSLLLTISNCIGQVAVLYARMHNMPRIYFGGYFIRGHPITMRTISYAINFWSAGESQALFLRHEGYLGAIGAFLKGAKEDTMKHVHLPETNSRMSWNEHYAGSSGLKNATNVPAAFSNQNANTCLVDRLEMDCSNKKLVPFPLLFDESSYTPDTVDLTVDHDARQYWLECLQNGVSKTVKKAMESQSYLEDCEVRAKGFQRKYVQHLRLLEQHPFLYGCLNVRSLLDLNEQLLREFSFSDAYHLQKKAENEAALVELPLVLQQLDELQGDALLVSLAKGLLAGNVFDWGAQDVVELMEKQGGLSFKTAKEKLQARPWLVDNFDEFLHRLHVGPPHKCALVFVDNSGADVVLGVIPFIRYLLSTGSKVILCANSKPALNDVTYNELGILCQRVQKLCPIINDKLKNGQLIISEHGQGSPCLDLCRIDGTLADLTLEHGVDLVVLEGMGRALHTNFYAKFACESLKVAVVKNQWLAERFGGHIFGVVFKYESSIG